MPGTIKPITMFGKYPVPLALQNLRHRLLDKSIQHPWDAKFPHPCNWLRVGFGISTRFTGCG